MLVYENVNSIKSFNLFYYPYYYFNKVYSSLKYYNIINSTFDADQIIDNLYIGSISSCYDINMLKQIGITHIISVIAGFEPPFPSDFEYLVINALDDENTLLKDKFKICNEFIENGLENNGKVLIHCVFGKSRSATILCAYLIDKFGMSYNNTLSVLQKKREIIEPNKFFETQLIEYYNQLYLLKDDKQL